MKTYWGSGGIDPRSINVGARWKVSDQLHAPAALSPGKEPAVPIG
jgi:hypothetical protein